MLKADGCGSSVLQATQMGLSIYERFGCQSGVEYTEWESSAPT